MPLPEALPSSLPQLPSLPVTAFLALGKARGCCMCSSVRPGSPTVSTANPIKSAREAMASLSSLPRETGKPPQCSLWGWGSLWHEGSTSLGMRQTRAVLTYVSLCPHCMEG